MEEHSIVQEEEKWSEGRVSPSSLETRGNENKSSQHRRKKKGVDVDLPFCVKEKRKQIRAINICTSNRVRNP